MSKHREAARHTYASYQNILNKVCARGTLFAFQRDNHCAVSVRLEQCGQPKRANLVRLRVQKCVDVLYQHREAALTGVYWIEVS